MKRKTARNKESVYMATQSAAYKYEEAWEKATTHAQDH